MAFAVMVFVCLTMPLVVAPCSAFPGNSCASFVAAMLAQQRITHFVTTIQATF
jgi:hypothetical protein